MRWDMSNWLHQNKQKLEEEDKKLPFLQKMGRYELVIVRNMWSKPEDEVKQGGFLCGYVGIPPDHPFYEKHYTDSVEANFDGDKHVDLTEDISSLGLFVSALQQQDLPEGHTTISLLLFCHGGVTYAGKKLPVFPEECSEDYWYFGFDCSHLGDRVPYLLPEIYKLYEEWEFDQEYRDFEYVKKHTLKLFTTLSKFTI